MKIKNLLSNSYVGSLGTVFAALCCLGTPAVLAFLGVIGLGFVINDFILFPLLAVFLGISIYGSFSNKKKHNNKYPLILTILGAVLLIPAIFFNVIAAYAIIAILLVSSIWDIVLVKNKVHGGN